MRGGGVLRWLLAFGLVLAGLHAAEVIPPVPRDHFNDYAGIVRPATARQLDAQLTQFERDTSNQLLVAIFPKMQSDSSIEDYTVRVAQSWGVGLKDRKNGAVLFIFSQDRKLYIQVGYGLEGVLTDALCRQIIANEITPRFRQGDFDGGVRAGTLALMAAARGEYRGTGRTVADRRNRGGSFPAGAGLAIGVFVMILGALLLRGSTRRQIVYSGRGRVSPWISTGMWGGNSSAGNWSGGRSSGGGSFSSGGGSFGGGGAGGSW